LEITSCQIEKCCIYYLRCSDSMCYYNPMEISFIAHTCFKIKGKEASLVIDPYDSKETGYKLPKLTAEIALHSHDYDFADRVEGADLNISTPGEYETKDIYIEGLSTYRDSNNGADRGPNTVYQILMDDFRILHMGALGHELKKETLEKIGEIDVLMIPVGGTHSIDAKLATKVIASIEPGIVIPMSYKTKETKGALEDLDKLKKFLDEMGVEKVTEVDKLKISNKSDIPEETQVIVITPTNQ